MRFDTVVLFSVVAALTVSASPLAGLELEERNDEASLKTKTVTVETATTKLSTAKSVTMKSATTSKATTKSATTKPTTTSKAKTSPHSTKTTTTTTTTTSKPRPTQVTFCTGSYWQGQCKTIRVGNGDCNILVGSPYYKNIESFANSYEAGTCYFHTSTNCTDICWSPSGCDEEVPYPQGYTTLEGTYWQPGGDETGGVGSFYCTQQYLQDE